MLGCIQPMSSPMMKSMLGLGCCADAGRLPIITGATNASRPSQIFLAMLMRNFLEIGCLRRAGRLRPLAGAPRSVSAVKVRGIDFDQTADCPQIDSTKLTRAVP